MNEIDKKQMEREMLNLLRARRFNYRRAKNIQAAGLIISLLFPVAGLIVSAMHLPSKPFIALFALTFSYVEALFFDRAQRSRVKKAAKLQEEFDCHVLQMDRNSFLVGSRVDPEEIYEDSYKKVSQKDDQKLFDWYPLAVKDCPMYLARLVCQRTNLMYDSALRQRYRYVLIIGCVLLTAIVAFAALVVNPSLSTFVMSTLAPMTPVIVWAIRESNRQAATCELLQRLKVEVDKLWANSLAGASADTLSTRSRELQDAIFNHRASSPLIFEWVYELMRSDMEKTMNAGAEALVAELRAAGLCSEKGKK